MKKDYHTYHIINLGKEQSCKRREVCENVTRGGSITTTHETFKESDESKLMYIKLMNKKQKRKLTYVYQIVLME